MFMVILVIKSPHGSFDTFLRLSGQIKTTLDDFNKVGEEMHNYQRRKTEHQKTINACVFKLFCLLSVSFRIPI